VDDHGFENVSPPTAPEKKHVIDVVEWPVPEFGLSLEEPPSAIEPGKSFILKGRLSLNGSEPVKGNVSVSLRKTMGSWSGEFHGDFELEIVVPEVEGTYRYRVTASTAWTPPVGIEVELNATGYVEVEVEYPFSEMVLAAKISNSVVDVSDVVVINGNVKFDSGDTRPGIEVIAMIPSHRISQHGTTDGQGNYTITLDAPDFPGNYDLEITAEGLGLSKTLTMKLQVNAELIIVKHVFPDASEPGKRIVLGGCVQFAKNYTAVRGALVIVEFMNTSHKALNFTDRFGGFEIEIWSPEHEGDYVLRITASYGINYTMVTKTISVEEKIGGDSIPFLSWIPVLLAVMLSSRLFCMRRDQSMGRR
jgi:hypothetical protein